MTTAVQQILASFARLSEVEQRQAAAEILRRVSGSVDEGLALEADEGELPPLTDAQEQDLRRRVAAYEANPGAGSSWADVKARLRERP